MDNTTDQQRALPAADLFGDIGLTAEQKREYDMCLDALCRMTHSFEPDDDQKATARAHALMSPNAKAQATPTRPASSTQNHE